jgi:hypothetical protein
MSVRLWSVLDSVVAQMVLMECLSGEAAKRPAQSW